MSKTGKFSASITLASSGQGEQSQIDLGPYTNPLPSCAQIGFNETNSALPSGDTQVHPKASGQIGAGFAMVLGILPVSVTAGVTLTLKGASTDVGFAISSINPTFLSCNVHPSNGATNAQYVWLNSSAATQLNLAWV